MKMFSSGRSLNLSGASLACSEDFHREDSQ